MTNVNRNIRMSEDELIYLIENEPWCKMTDGCDQNFGCDNCLRLYIKSTATIDVEDLLESKRDGFFECHMKSCIYTVSGKCTNPCYLDCPFYSLRQSLRELVKRYEEIVTKL